MQQSGFRHPMARIKLQVKVYDNSGSSQDNCMGYFGQTGLSNRGSTSYGMLSHPSKRICRSFDEVSNISCADLSEFSVGRNGADHMGSLVHQFLVLANPYDSLKDLRKLIHEKHQKLYPTESVPTFLHLRDANGCDLDDEFVVGEVYEPNDVVVIVSSLSAVDNGVITPQSILATPIQKPVLIAFPTPKTIPAPLFGDSSSGTASKDSEQIHELTVKANSESEDESESECESSESADSEEETESEEEESKEETAKAVSETVTPIAESAKAPSVLSVDDKIAAAVNGYESSSEYEVDASSTDSSSESEADEADAQNLTPAPVTTNEVVSSSEYETDSGEDSSEEESESEAETVEVVDKTVEATKKTPLTAAMAPAAEESSTEEESEEDSETESEEESEEESSEESETEVIKTKAEEDSKVSSSESDSSSDSEDDEMVTSKIIPSTNVVSTLDLPLTANDLQQALKEVPKYTSLTTLKDCLSLAVSGRATPLQPQEKTLSASQPVKKGRVILPRRKNNSSGYDASLFS